MKMKDQSILCKTPIVSQIMGSSVLFYDKKNQTRENFFTMDVPTCAPIYELRKHFVNDIVHLSNMNLSLEEVSIFVALMTVSIGNFIIFFCSVQIISSIFHLKLITRTMMPFNIPTCF